MGWTLQWNCKPTNIHHLARSGYELNNVTDDVDISMNDISKDETEEGLRALGNRKGAGLDFIPRALLKWGDAMVLELTKTASIVWNTLQVSYVLNCGVIVKLKKKRISPNMIIGEVSLSW